MCRLLTVDRSHIPSNVVAPAHGLNPVYRAWVDPYQVSWPLDEPVHRDVSAVQVIQNRPPWSCQVVDSMPERKIHKLLNKVFILTKIRVRIKHCLAISVIWQCFCKLFLTFHRNHWWPPSSCHEQQTTHSLQAQYWCLRNRSYCSPGVLMIQAFNINKKTTCQSRLSIYLWFLQLTNHESY